MWSLSFALAVLVAGAFARDRIVIAVLGMVCLLNTLLLRNHLNVLQIDSVRGHLDRRLCTTR